MALAHLTALHPAIHLEPDDIAVVSRQISLGLVGIIILSSIRRVLIGVARVSLISLSCSAWIDKEHDMKVLRVSSRNLGASLMLLMIAQLMVRSSTIHSSRQLRRLLRASTSCPLSSNSGRLSLRLR